MEAERKPASIPAFGSPAQAMPVRSVGRARRLARAEHLRTTDQLNRTAGRSGTGPADGIWLYAD
jgi:hypothetical protein